MAHDAWRRTPVDWNTFDERVEILIERERRFLCQTLGEAVGKLFNEERTDTMRAVRDELYALKVECAKFASEVAELRAALAIERSRPVDPTALPRSVN
jgi:hypothetical protein